MGARSWPRPVYTLLNNLNDAATMPRLSRNLIPIPLLLSNWVDPAAYEPHLQRRREYDIVMVANFSTYKRHWLFFKMLRDLPKSTRVLLVGVPLGARTEQVLRDEARAFGVDDRFELRMRLTDDAVAEALCSAKVSAIFSRQEGSCLAVVEAMFANTPVAVFRDAIVGSKAYVNPHTGLQLEPRNIARQMQQFIETADRYTPRAWACEHISCHRSYDVLNGFLRTDAEQNGRPWTRDLEPFYQNAVPRYLTESSELRMKPWYDDFARSYGLTIAEPAWSAGAEKTSSENSQPLMRAGA
jgi:glycosyltransferase involved in cell wall biosynthesis